MQMRIVNFFFRRELFRRGVVSSRHSESKWTSAANRHVTMTRRSSHLLLPSTLRADRHPSNIQQRSGACIYRWTRPFECGASFVDDLVHTRFALFVFKNKNAIHFFQTFSWYRRTAGKSLPCLFLIR